MPHHSDKASRAVNALADRFSAVLGPLVEPGTPFALMDFPDHANIGDSAIYAGEIAFLDAHVGRPASYVCSAKTYRRDVDAFCPEGPILLHGGGNFGDVWPAHQSFRHDVIAAYRNRKIVQMPQSIQFDDAKGIEATARVIGHHPDFTLLVRDEPSLELARQHFDCAVHLCPDAAYALRRLPASTDGAAPVVSLLRLDREAAWPEAARLLSELGPVVDWPAWSRWRRPFATRVVQKVVAPRFPGSAPLMRHRERAFRDQALRLVRQGVAILEQGRLVVSDRLHAHILSSLIRRPHVLLDNRYGKLGRFIDCWGNDGLAEQAPDLPALKATLARLKASAPGHGTDRPTTFEGALANG